MSYLYCDYNATTPLRPEALEAMLPFLREQFGNPSSVHQLGSAARCAVEEARGYVAELVGARPAEITFTGGGTESNHLAILGSGGALPVGGALSTAIEHPSVRSPLARLEARGWSIRHLPLRPDGCVSLDTCAEALWQGVRFVSVAWANNEIGAVQPMRELGVRCRDRGVLLHSDAVQAVGKIPVDCGVVDLLSIAAHKLGGPKGVGALFVRGGVTVEPLLLGGGQERERRAGTENVAGIVGFGAACRIARARLDDFGRRCRAWREALFEGFHAAIPGCHRNSGGGGECLPNTLHVSFDGVRGEALVAALDLARIAMSSGSACAAGAGEPSHVLLALGRNEDQARNGARFSCGFDSEQMEVGQIVEQTRLAVARIRKAAQSV